MAITPQQLRYDYPEFGSTAVYPDSQIQYWFTLAYLMMDANRWGKVLDIGAELFVAHHISIEARNQAIAANGGVPGEGQGPVSGKSVDKVSMSYDTGAAIEPGAGHWNLTTYGTRFVQLMKMFGAGPVHIGLGSAPALSGMAWPGPSTIPGSNNF